MKKIYTLPEDIIAKIAAGEVIERPVYAVKELIENSIDAGADSIKIEIEESGLKKIAITDNGEGMSEDDIKVCFKPHTTSKIKSFDDLNSISTLGFRGEAISSIAAISDISIKSKNADKTSGIVLDLKIGRLENISPIGMPIGTSITVNNLFYPVPARKKFLKSERTEYKHILDLIISYAISFPNIRFFMSHNKKRVLDLPKTIDRKERIKILLGDSVFNQLIPVLFDDTYIKILGFISKPQLTTSNLSKNFIFINQRKVLDKLINLAVKEAYGNLLEKDSYPVFILFLSLPCECVDVNIHPRKEQVNFVDGKLIYDQVYKAVSQTLTSNNLTFYNLSGKKQEYSGRLGNTNSYAANLLKEEVIPWNMQDIAKILNLSDILQVHNTYLITQTKQGILIIDQHAAHERILYEQFFEEYEKHKKQAIKYNLPQSVLLELDLLDRQILKENIELFEKIGFEIEYFKGNTFKINCVPLLFKDRNFKKLIKEIIDDVTCGKNLKEVDKQSIKMIEYLACRSAIKAGDKLTKKECKDLIEKLEKTKSNYTCPHGRPAKIEISLNELAKYFKRV